MKKRYFFLKLIIAALVLLVFCFVIVMPQYTYNNQAALIDKVNRLESIEGQKVTLVGNSNLAFGINSKLLEEQIGLPVANMGLHGGVGNGFNEKAAKINIHEGDIIILSPSSFYDNGSIKNPELAWVTIENNLSLWRFVGEKDILPMIKAFPTYFKKCVDKWATGTGNLDTEPIYSRTMYNEYGDNIYDRPVSEPDLDLSSVAIPQITDDYINRINELNQYVTQRGGTLCIAAYPIAVYEKTPSAEEYAAFEQELRSRLDCYVISTYTDYMLDKAYFFNTYLHLTNEGANIRTQLLAKDIKRLQEQLQTQ